ncbi:hypothetical protein COB64_02250 [Candidatus Wolfebacteria bacterium]|nr:MAG: hypothetical protein COB64_02250 [Candidatus Wolfebacteria bacterium]
MYVTHCYYIVHYHPELVRIIRKELVERKYAPEGWVTPNKLKSEFHASPATVKSFAEKYRDSNPEWFNNYLIGGTYTEYYHPKLVRIIRKELPKRKNKE